MTAPNHNRNGLSRNPLWYKSGVIYEVHVRSFYDADADGTGDFRGLTEKLDYIKELGATAIWLLPFYPSPLKDDGYDIADYCGVHPKYGTMGDFTRFLREAHDHDLRVITELVLNHTSDQHPWFQRARHARPGSKRRNFYVWSDSAEKYRNARVIFKDVEVSNWTWDKAAGAYYWHRFFSHQPDLNYDNPDVCDALLRVMDFWFDLGVDGLRLDAVPYLFEREGTSCENLPETHEFLKRLRRHVDEKYGDRMLLAEANQWPEDAVAYFGDGRGDECHMAFHFPLMPRLFMALRMEDRIPVVDILQQTPAIPETAQWALFLRNHDELTLATVTDEERDYMYRMYAHVRQARLNLGIRRRLAPLVGNERKRIELLVALLFSLPGTPVIYYGDEIGMGDNIYLGDRNGVRTPMQWSADKNAGFSRANPQSLYLPINLDPENHYEAVNVEVQERNPHSLLWWTKRLIALYKRWKSLGLGTIEFLHPENRRVFACLRRYQEEAVLVVANLSRFIQPVELDLGAFGSRVPVELFGRTEFPAITDRPYFLTLAPHAFCWFSLEAKAPARVELVGGPVGAEARPVIAVEEDWQEIFLERNRVTLERALQNWLPSRRWFGGKSRTIKAVNIQEIIPVPTDTGKTFLAFLRVEYVQGEPDIYCLPLACAFGEQADGICRDWSALVLARLAFSRPDQYGVLHDALANKAFCAALLKLMSSRRSVAGKMGELEATHTAVLRRLRMEGALALEPSASKAEQSNSAIIYGDRLILKLFRRLDAGTNPDLEISRFLSARNFPHAPLLAGALEYRGKRDELTTLAVLTSFVPGCQNAWDYTLDALSRFYERVHTLRPEQRQAPPLPTASVSKLAGADLTDQAREMIGTYLESARLLGRVTAAMHVALASESADPNFRSEPSTPHSQRGLFQSVRNLTRQNFQLLSQHLKNLPSGTRTQAQQVLGLEAEVLKLFRAVYERSIDTVRIRHHGNYHLGQLLYTGKDFLIIDFEGEPAIALSERRLKRSPLRDVAGMIRSFHYAAHAALLDQVKNGTLEAAQMEALAAWVRFWSRWVGATFYKAYRQTVGTVAFLPPDETDLRVMMDAHLLRKAVCELGNELNHRADWVTIPLQGILELVNPIEPA
jgi:maltose alpha-D-glucosyltransferase / alpha-amylase